MSKSKTNALDALRALIAERQQYEQWISTLDAKKDNAPEHVYERVRGDYVGRLDRVVNEIRGHAEELQLSISTLSSRLVEVARDEDTRRESLQEAELRAAVGEYEQDQWSQIKSEAEQAIEKIAADRKSLDDQLSELRSIQKLSETSTASVGAPAVSTPEPSRPTPPAAQTEIPIEPVKAREPEPPPSPRAEEKPVAVEPQRTPPAERLPLAEPVANAAASVASATARPKSNRTPPGGVAAASRAKSEAAKPDAAKTLKCPECGTPNYPTEWYCERCGGELATM